MTETTSDTTMETETAATKAGVKTDEKPEGKANVTSEEKSEVKTEVKTEVKPEETATNGSTKDESKTDEVKSEDKVTVKEENLLQEEIVQQIHYYFGNMNLPRDKFLQEQIKLDDGWIPVEVMLKFNRLAELSKDVSVILAAVRTQDIPLIEISEDKTKIRRSPAYPLPELNEEWRKTVAERTIYNKGFPPTGVPIGDLLAFFKKFGPVDNIQKRTYFDKANKTVIFKGSVFVTFDSKDTAAKYIGLESVKWGDTELTRKFQADYWDDKKKERDERWGRKAKKGKSEKQQDQKEDELDALPRGCIFHLAGLPVENSIDRDAIREKVTEAGGDVAYITYNRGDEEAFVRLQGDDENPAVKLLETISEKKLTINDVELTARVLEGDEETEFLKKSLEDRDRRRGRNRNKNSFRGRRRRGDGDDGPPRKCFKRERN